MDRERENSGRELCVLMQGKKTREKLQARGSEGGNVAKRDAGGRTKRTTYGRLRNKIFFLDRRDCFSHINGLVISMIYLKVF